MGLLVQASILALVLTLLSPLTHALGLGEVKLNSSLYQPLDAEIQLLQTRELTSNEIIVTMAPREAFDRAGVEKTYFVVGLKFKVDMDNPRGPVVRITSKTPVKEPFLNFIVQAQWPSGKLLREYTLLMDLPVFSEEKAAPVTAAKKAPPRQTSRPEPRPQQPQQRQPSPRVTPASDGDGEVFGPVRSTDTLWAIASENRPSSDVSIHKTMVAIQRLNPNAFINGNINLLKKGQILRLPSMDDIDGMSQSEAVNTVASQNNQWRSGDTEVSDAQLTASSNYESSSEDTPTVEGRVKLSSVGSQDASLEGRGSGDEPSSTEARLTAAKEELSASKLENEELKDRISDMQESIEAMEKLISLHSEDMAKLELALKENEELRQKIEEARENGTVPETVESSLDSAEQPELTEAEAQEALAGEDGLETTEDPATDLAEGAVDAPAEVVSEAANTTPEVEQTPPPPPPPAKKSMQEEIMDLLMANLIYVAGGLVLLIGLIIYFLMSRGNDDFDEDDYDYEDGLTADSDISDSDTTDTVIAGLNDDLMPDDTELMPDQPADEIAEPSLHPETDDVAGEADIHIAYSDFETAERMLLTAMEKDPHNTVNHLKLLEVYSRQGDIEKFDPQYASLRAYADQESLDRAAQLRGYIDDAPAFDDNQVGAAAPAPASSFDEPADDDSTLEFEINTAADDEELSLDDLDTELTLDDDELSFDSGSDSIVDGLDDISLDDVPVAESSTSALVENSEDDFNVSLDEALGGDDLDLGEDSPISEDDLDLNLDDAVLGLDLEGSDDLSIETSEDGDEDLDIDFADVEVNIDGDDLATDDVTSDDFDLGDADLDLSGGDLDLGGEANLLSESFDSDTSSADPLPSLSDDDMMAESAEADDGADLDFDDLDKDLDALASGFEGDLHDLDDTSSEDDFEEPDSLVMEEPVTDFDGLDLEEGTDASFEEIEEEKVDLDALVDLDGEGESDAGLDFSELDDSIEGLSDDALVTDDADDLVIPGGDAGDAAAASLDVGLDDLSSEMGDLDITAAPTPAAAPEPAPAKAPASESGEDFELPDFDPESDDDSDLGFLSDRDELSTKLDLLRVFVDMGDADSAMHTYEEIKEEGTDEQKREAEQLVAQLD